MTVCDIDAKAFLEAIFFNYNDTEETPVLGQTRQRPSDGTTVFWGYPWPGADPLEMHHASLALQLLRPPSSMAKSAEIFCPSWRPYFHTGCQFRSIRCQILAAR